MQLNRIWFVVGIKELKSTMQFDAVPTNAVLYVMGGWCLTPYPFPGWVILSVDIIIQHTLFRFYAHNTMVCRRVGWIPFVFVFRIFIVI